jgi:hypothetical protein
MRNLMGHKSCGSNNPQNRILNAEVSKYYDLKGINESKKNGTSWWARKLWNENTVEIQGDGYWLSLNPILDLQVGKASQHDSIPMSTLERLILEVLEIN